MMRENIPTLLLGLTVCAYWLNVGNMILRVRRDAGRVGRVLIPQQRSERLMWLLWVPLVFAWINLPLGAAINPAVMRNGWLGLPALVGANPALFFVRCLAAGVAIACLALSTWCWRHMGTNWRMAVDPTRESVLIVDGPFSWVRHPIYALSITLMACSVIVLPSPAMLLIAIVHICLMQLKARNEERFLLQRHGEAYARYCDRVGRFFPSMRLRSPAS